MPWVCTTDLYIYAFSFEDNEDKESTGQRILTRDL